MDPGSLAGVTGSGAATPAASLRLSSRPRAKPASRDPCLGWVRANGTQREVVATPWYHGYHSRWLMNGPRLGGRGDERGFGTVRGPSQTVIRPRAKPACPGSRSGVPKAFRGLRPVSRWTPDVASDEAPPRLREEGAARTEASSQDVILGRAAMRRRPACGAEALSPRRSLRRRQGRRGEGPSIQR